MSNHSSHRFLIADDKVFLRNLIQSMLLRHGVREIFHAADGQSAIRVLSEPRDQPIDCVLCDWNMEPVDGLAVLRSIRMGDVDNTPRDLRFIMLTGTATERVVKAAMELDTTGYLVKPVSLDKLIRAIDNAFSKTISLKPKEAYRAQGIIGLPDAVAAPDKHVPPWVLMSRMREKSKAILARELEHIRQERDEALKRHPVLTRLIINEHRLDLDEIQAGKVLAEDTYTEHGTLLLARGSALTESLLARLRTLEDITELPIRLLVGDFGE